MLLLCSLDVSTRVCERAPNTAERIYLNVFLTSEHSFNVPTAVQAYWFPAALRAGVQVLLVSEMEQAAGHFLLQLASSYSPPPLGRRKQAPSAPSTWEAQMPKPELFFFGIRGHVFQNPKSRCVLKAKQSPSPWSPPLRRAGPPRPAEGREGRHGCALRPPDGNDGPCASAGVPAAEAAACTRTDQNRPFTRARGPTRKHRKRRSCFRCRDTATAQCVLLKPKNHTYTTQRLTHSHTLL